MYCTVYCNRVNLKFFHNEAFCFPVPLGSCLCVFSVWTADERLLSLRPPQSVQLSRCPDNDFDIDKREKVGKREDEKEKKRHGKISVKRVGSALYHK